MYYRYRRGIRLGLFVHTYIVCTGLLSTSHRQWVSNTNLFSILAKGRGRSFLGMRGFSCLTQAEGDYVGIDLLP